MEQKERLHRMLIERLYSHRILNNSHRGDFVEMMVLDALGPEWRHVGLGWNIWIFNAGTASSAHEFRSNNALPDNSGARRNV